MSRIDYRPDVDGLRGLSVLAVALFHYQIPGFAGGFVGVDVFFVISGFLITKLILKQTEGETFSLVEFYERRIRRILPALFIVLIASLLAALVLFLPRDLAAFGESLAATAAFVSNFQLWRETSYFAAASHTKPLLHTWSLAVEEQFYLVYPPVLLLLLRKAPRRWLMPGLAALAMMSLAVSEGLLTFNHRAAFFLTPSRGFELLAGAMAALPAAGPLRARLAKLPGSGLFGLGLIAWSIVMYSARTPFPGLAATIPCLGAVMVICSGENRSALSTKLLSCRPLVGMGLISYSYYLWHWPILVFAGYDAQEALPISLRIALLAGALLLAIASWHFVEQPVRKGSLLRTRRSLFVTAALASFCAAGVGLALLLSGGMPKRVPETVIAIAGGKDGPVSCPGQVLESDAKRGFTCRFGDPRAKADIFVWGDSHASVLLPALHDMALRSGRGGILSYHAACPPLLGVRKRVDGRCATHNSTAAGRARAPEVRDVILAARWAAHAEGWLEVGGGGLVLEDGEGPAGRRNNHDVFERGLSRTVEVLRNADKRVIIVRGAPEAPVHVPETLAKRHWRGGEVDLRIDRSAYDHRHAFVTQATGRLARRGVILIDPSSVLCTAKSCRFTDGRNALYADSHHLNDRGAALMIPLIENALKPPS